MVCGFCFDLGGVGVLFDVDVVVVWLCMCCEYGVVVLGDFVWLYFNFVYGVSECWMCMYFGLFDSFFEFLYEGLCLMCIE